MDDAVGEQVGSPQPGEPQPITQQQLFDEVIFKRDLNEGFLLIDHISGRSEKSLRNLDVSGLKLPGCDTPLGNGSSATISDVWRKFCEIRYPPSPEPRVKAENAAFVLDMKDRLNALASPARGITIAYTMIFVSRY